MRHAKIYARYSPRPKESDSISAQAADLQDFCAKQGWEVDLIGFDPDVSGTVPFYARPGLADVLKTLQRGDVLVVRSLSRSARSLSVALAIEEEVERAGARLAVLEDGGLQQTKDENRSAWCMRVIRHLMNDMERMEINERTRRRMQQHQRNGRSVGGVAPYGWSRKGKTLVPDPQEQETLKAIIQLAEIGCTPGEIARRLRNKGVKARGSRWHTTTVVRILKAQKEGRQPAIQAS